MIRRLAAFLILSIGMNMSTAQADDQTVIREMLRVQTEAWNQVDGPEWAKDFTDDCDFINIRGDVFHGRSDLGSRVAAILHGPFKGSHLSLSVRRFTLLAPDVALIETDHEVTGFPGMVPGIAPTAEGVLRTHMKYVAVKRNAKWYFAAAQNTAVSPSALQR
jgi:uncharacterized protein (TIGR02246 family)